MPKATLSNRIKSKNEPRRPISDKKTKVLSGRIMQSRVRELKELYPVGMTESEIINDLIKEKLARAKFDRWLLGMKENFDINDFNLESLR